MLEETINSWIFDYAFWQAWHEFKSMGSVDSKTDRDFLQACIRITALPMPYRDIQVRFLHVLTRLADGLSYSMSFNDGITGTVLESGYYHFSELMTFFPEMKVEFANMSLEFLRQAVFVCCVDKNFSLAETVFRRLGSQNILKMSCFSQTEIEEVEKEIRTILSSRNSKHHILIEKDYCSFIQNLIDVLEIVQQKIPDPFLITVFKDKVISGESSRPVQTKKTDNLRTIDKNSFPNSVNRTSSNDQDSNIVRCEEKSNTVSPVNPSTTLAIGGKGLSPSTKDKKKLKRTTVENNRISQDDGKDDGDETFFSNNSILSSEAEISGLASSVDEEQLEIDNNDNIASQADRRKLKEIFQYLLNCHRKISPESIRIFRSRAPSEEIPTSPELLKTTIKMRLQKLGLITKDSPRLAPVSLSLAVSPCSTPLHISPQTSLCNSPSSTRTPVRITPTRTSLCMTPTKTFNLLPNSPSSTPLRQLKVMCVPMENDRKIPEQLRVQVKEELTSSNHKKTKRSRLSLAKSSTTPEKTYLSDKYSNEAEISVVKTPASQLPSMPKGTFKCRKSLLYVRDSREESNKEWLCSRRLPKRNFRGRLGKAWSPEEELKLYSGVVKYGAGKWAFIRNEFGLYNRTVINLSDKWRNLQKNKESLKRLKKKFESAK